MAMDEALIETRVDNRQTKHSVVLGQASTRLDWLDALRGWAVLGVVTTHAEQVSHVIGIESKISAAGQYGVQLFFLVSALTISLTYESHIRRYGAGGKSQFAWLIKRFFRIAPLYYIAAIFYPLEQLAIYKGSAHHYGALISIPNIVANLLFVHTWVPSANNSVVPGGWSIGVEMCFYILVPLIWSIQPVRRRVLVLSISAIGFLATTLFISAISSGTLYVPNNTYLYYWFPTQAPVIIIGLVFYCLRGGRFLEMEKRREGWVYFLGFLLCLWPAFYLGTGNEVAPIFAPSILAVSFVLLIMGLQGWLRGFIVNKYAVALGRISFSVYIVHFVVLDGLRIFIKVAHLERYRSLVFFPALIIGLGLTCLLAYVTKRFIEDPGVALGHRISRSVASVDSRISESLA
jgi:peptidoglycan/LPS O-acetylase OafA/YrhL